MSHLVKKLTVIAIAMFVLLSMSAFAQNTVNPKLIASAGKDSQPAKAATAPQHSAASSQSWMTHRFEISFQAGGVVGGSLGRADLGACKSSAIGTPAASDGCNPNQWLHSVDNMGGVYTGNTSGVRYFQRYGGIQPGNGGLWGTRLGWSVSPRWQIEFIFNHARTATSFTNESMARDQLAQITDIGFDGDHRLQINNGWDGRPKGEQNMYLVNINRTFNAGHRVVPYIGAGLGAVHWYDGPALDFISSRSDDANFFQVAKHSQSDTGFAWDLAAGAKFFMTEHFGVRGEVMNVMSFPGSIKQEFRTIDTTGLYGTPGALAPMSGTVTQNGRFNQTLFTGGVFWAFGGGWGAPPQNAGSFASDNFWDHWELSFNFGGVHGQNLGSTGTKCTPAAGIVDGCILDNGDRLAHDNGSPGAVYRTTISGTLPGALGSGSVLPGDGWASGLRLSYSFTPNWDIAFIWNVAGTGTHYDNKEVLDRAIAGFEPHDSSVNAIPAPSLDFLNGRDGTPRGNQSMYLVNVNRSFHVTRRFVPYFGAGLGWESWNNGPGIQLREDLSSAGQANVADFVKSTHNESGFAFDIAGGAKYYLTRHFGVRFDAMQVLSWHDVRQDFASIDTNGVYGTPGAVVPVAGRLRSDGNFGQLVTTAGIFYSFGQGGTWKSDYSNTGESRWDLSFQTGGIVGGNLGRTDNGSCKSISVSEDGCDLGIGHSHTIGSGVGILPGKAGGLRVLQRSPNVEPGNGGFYGVRLGYSFTPEWQVEFIYNHARTRTAFVNQDVIDETLPALQTNKRTDDFRDAFIIDGANGKPKGDQNQYLVNLNRKFNVSGRFVPYVGVGGGMVSWYGGPNMNVFVSNPAANNNPITTDVAAYSGRANGFAFDLATGAKAYVGRNYGFRFDFTDVMSFPSLSHRSTTADFANLRGFGVGALLPISGKINQSGRFNQAMFSAGVFWDSGGRNLTGGASSPTGDRESMNDKWELGFNFGGVHGSRLGDDTSKCTPTVPEGCNTLAGLVHDGGGGIFPGREIDSLPNFMTQGTVKPGDGYTTGFELGYNWSPDWQISFIYNIAGTGTRFSNESLLHQAITGFAAGRGNQTGTEVRVMRFGNSTSNGTPKGTQHQLLVNLTRSFRTNSRIVPYVGGGMGAVIWANNPLMDFVIDTTDQSDSGAQVPLFIKSVPNKTGFALDLSGGLKFYVSRHWGFKAGMLNVLSFQSFSARSTSDDLSGLLGTPGAIVPISGRVSQSTRFLQTSGTGGVFFTF